MTSPTKAKSVANRSSDTKQGEGWWMASDRRWYPPELHPSYKKPAADQTQAAAAAAKSATAPAAATAVAKTAASAPAAKAAAQTAASAPAATQATAAKPAAQPAAQAAAQAAAQPTAKGASPQSKPAGDQINIKQATPTPRQAPTTPRQAQTQAPTQTQTNFQTPPAAPTQAPAHASSGATGETAVVEEEESINPNLIAGIFAGVGAVLAMIGSFLSWAVNTGQAVPGGPYDVSFSGFDSNGVRSLMLAVIMLVFASLLVKGVKPGWIFGLIAFACGACIIGTVLYSYLDITGKASEAWASEVAAASGVPRSDLLAGGVGLRSNFGLWATGVGGLLGLLTPPFLRRDAEDEDGA